MNFRYSRKLRNIFLLCFFLLCALFFYPSVFGQSEFTPTVVFSGDDLLQNGGTDDAYDSLLIIDITAVQVNPEVWDLEYSNDGGQNWSEVIANYSSLAANRRIYDWSTSKIYAPTLLFRARTQAGGEWSDYFQEGLSLSHRVTNNSSHYFIEGFNNNDFKDFATDANWDTGQALLELKLNPPNYHPNSSAFSTNLLSALTNENVLAVTFQPVQWPYGQTIRYQLSNDGVNWYGDTSGISKNNVWFNFGDQAVPDAVTVPFNDSSGTGLYWRIYLSTTNTLVSPQVFQLRFSWEENNIPVACFTVTPGISTDPEEVYTFNGNCSSDYEDSLSNMEYRWDWENDDTYDTAWQTGIGGYIYSHNYSSTSTYDIKLEVRDSNGATDTFLNSINEPGVQGSVAGWAWSSNYGWISLNCDNTYYATDLRICPPNYGWQLNEDYSMEGWAWSSNLGWLCLGRSCSAYGTDPINNNTPSASYSRSTGEVTGWGKFINFGESGWLWLRGTWCGTGEDQCVSNNFSRRTLEGWAWAGGRTLAGVANGPGWVQFLGNINVPWLETKYSTVYGRNDVGSLDTAMPPSSRYSASYCILSGGDIVNFTSESGCSQAVADDLNFPNVSQRYRTILGMIDFERILDGEEETYQSADVDANLPSVLGGKVYHFNNLSSYTIDQPIVFNNARNLNSSGAGTIVVDGDLYINSNLYYESNSVTSQIENLASVAWIVKGDVIVSPDVSQLVGNFIILGKEGQACPADSCGSFKTGDDSSSPNQLTVRGLIMAKQFYFQRTYRQGSDPAEVIIYDGRVLINTPPGLTDIAKGLPVWREAYTTTQIEQ